MGRNCLFVRKGEKRKKKGLIKKFLSPSFLLCPTFSLSPNCLKSCDSHNLQSALQQTTTATAKRQGFPPDRPTVSSSVCLERRSSNNLSKIAALQFYSFPSLGMKEFGRGRIIAHSASKSLAAAHSPVCRRSLLQKTDQNNRRRERGRDRPAICAANAPTR